MEIVIVTFSEPWGAGTSAPVWKSRDGGFSWHKITQIGAGAWKEITNGGLSTESKAAAAKSLLSALSQKGDAPEDLLAAAGETKPDGNKYAHKDKSDIEGRIIAASKVLEEIMGTPDKAIPDKVMTEAKCIAVIPSMVKVAIGFGGSHGKGVATCRAGNGKWSAPAPITITGGNWGLQLGGQAVDLVMIVTNDQGMRHLLSSKFKLGADASAAVGPVGRNAEAGTDWKMKADVLTYSRARGLFAGINLNGSAIAQDKEESRILYGQQIPLESILGGKVASPTDAGRNFVGAVEKYSPGAGPRAFLDSRYSLPRR
jgi:SH3 domain-containing YSC84-like protein 1